LQHIAAAVQLSFTWMGVRRTLSPDQKALAAEPFGAAAASLSAAKKILDSRHPAYQALSSVRHRMICYWKGATLPYPEPGIRLIRQEHVEPFDGQMTQMRDELNEAVDVLEGHYDELKGAAQLRLGTLFDPSDYPESLKGLFAAEWEFPALEPPTYLQRLNPELYRQEQARIAARFDEAVALAESAFLGEFARLVSHLTERLAGNVDGQKKVFRDSAIENLSEFFERFRTLGIHSSAELDALVATAQQAVSGVEPQKLRDSDALRARVGAELTRVQSVLDGLLVDRPRRKILRLGSDPGEVRP
jgi:hypothetical protein